MCVEVILIAVWDVKAQLHILALVILKFEYFVMYLLQELHILEQVHFELKQSLHLNLHSQLLKSLLHVPHLLMFIFLE